MRNIRFDVLDSFRGLCAMSVVLFHIRTSSGISDLSFFRGSDILVDFFFILSGFVLTHGYAFKDDIKFKNYFVSRFFRIYPLHIVMLLVFISLEALKYVAYKKLGITFNTLPFTGVNSLSEILPSVFLVQAWFRGFERLSFNFPSWSISVEFYLYMIFFLTILFRGIGKYIMWAIISVISFVMIASHHEILTPSSLRGLSCFFGGALTYCVFRRLHLSLPAVFATAVELTLLLTISIAVSSEFAYREMISSFLFMVTILFFAFESGYISKMLKCDLLKLFGKLSYSIYMTHAALLFCVLSVLVFVQKKTGMELSYMEKNERIINLGSPFLNSLLAIFCLTLVVLISCVTYRIIEKKGIALGKKFTE